MQEPVQHVASARPRRAPMALVTWAFVVLVLVIVVVLLILKVTRGSATAPVPPVTPAPADVVHAAQKYFVARGRTVVVLKGTQ